MSSRLETAPPDTAITPGANPRTGFGSWAAFIGCSSIWGSTFLVISIGNDAVPPLWAASLRLLLAALLLTGIAKLLGSGLPRGRARLTAAQFGLTNFGFGFCLLYWGEQRVPSGMAAVIFGTIPLATACFAAAFGLEPLRPLKVSAALVAFGGVVVLFSSELRASVAPARLAAIVLSAVLASLSGVLLKRGPRQSPFGLNAVAAWVGFTVCVTASLLAGERHLLPRTLGAIAPILYLTIVGSIGAFVLFTWLVGRWPVTRVSFISVVVPVVALLLGSVMRHEPLGAASAVGVALVLTGLVMGIAADQLAAARLKAAGA